MNEDFSSLLSNMAQLEIQINTSNELISENPDAHSESVEIEEETLDSTDSKRSLRKRSTSEDSLHRTRNRKILKPKKNAASMQFETEKEVKNFYLNINKKFKQPKTQPLETIPEKDETLSDDDGEDDEKQTGKGRKAKRMLTICDGFNITKALKDKRKGLIKKHLGNKKKPKKMALAKFMEYFKEKLSDTSESAV